MAEHNISDVPVILDVQRIEEYHTPECVQQNHAERLGRTDQEEIFVATKQTDCGWSNLKILIVKSIKQSISTLFLDLNGLPHQLKYSLMKMLRSLYRIPAQTHMPKCVYFPRCENCPILLASHSPISAK